MDLALPVLPTLGLASPSAQATPAAAATGAPGGLPTGPAVLGGGPEAPEDAAKPSGATSRRKGARGGTRRLSAEEKAARLEAQRVSGSLPLLLGHVLAWWEGY